MNNKAFTKIEKNKTPKRELKNLKKDGIKNLFNKSNKIKQEEYKSIGEIKKLNENDKKLRLKSARVYNPFKISYSRNYNDYKQILKELTDINTSKINWAMKLRKDQLISLMKEKEIKSKNKNLKNIQSAKPATKGLILTSNFIEPKFYMDDLEKFRKKIGSKKRPLSSILNPNFNNVKHLFANRINLQSKEFASSLRFYNTKKNNENKKIKWNNCFSKVNKSRDNAYYASFLLPKTEEGKKNLKRLEKKISTPYQVIFKDIILGNDNIKQKILTPKRDFSYSGVGSYLDLGNYRTNYGVKNTSLNEQILKTESNSQCLFELGLRNYPKNKTKI